MISISWAITACNEYEELTRLLTKLQTKPQDEIVVLLDKATFTKGMVGVLNVHEFSNGGVGDKRFYFNNLDKNFAAHKNVLAEHCTKDYIFQLDADEYPHDYLMENVHKMLDANPEIDVFLLPRINTVSNMTAEDVKKYGWKLSNGMRINWPDFQGRIYKNNGKIKWDRAVHEVLIGFDTYAVLPTEDEFSLYHPKDIERQRKQNEFYDTIQ